MEQIKDLVKMAKNFETADISALLETAYIRGYEEGKQVMKAIIADVVKDK